MSTQTSSAPAVNKSNPIVGAAGIRYHKPAGADAEFVLKPQPGDAWGTVPAAHMRTMITELFNGVEDAWSDIANSTNLIEDATAGGRAHGNAQIVAFLVRGNDTNDAYGAQGELLLDQRREGVEFDVSTVGDLGAVERQMAVDYFREQSDLFNAEAEEPGFSPDVTAHFQSMATVMADAALDLSSEI
jgi:hypothetical protein